MPRTLTVIPRHVIEGALGEAEYDEIRESYSGRGMYGGSCFGVVLSAQREFSILILRARVRESRPGGLGQSGTSAVG